MQKLVPLKRPPTDGSVFISVYVDDYGSVIKSVYKIVNGKLLLCANSSISNNNFWVTAAYPLNDDAIFLGIDKVPLSPIEALQQLIDKGVIVSESGVKFKLTKTLNDELTLRTVNNSKPYYGNKASLDRILNENFYLPSK